MMSKVTHAVIGRAGMDTTLLLSWAALTVLTDDGDNGISSSNTRYYSKPLHVLIGFSQPLYEVGIVISFFSPLWEKMIAQRG